MADKPAPELEKQIAEKLAFSDGVMAIPGAEAAIKSEQLLVVQMEKEPAVLGQAADAVQAELHPAVQIRKKTTEVFTVSKGVRFQPMSENVQGIEPAAEDIRTVEPAILESLAAENVDAPRLEEAEPLVKDFSEDAVVEGQPAEPLDIVGFNEDVTQTGLSVSDEAAEESRQV